MRILLIVLLKIIELTIIFALGYGFALGVMWLWNKFTFAEVIFAGVVGIFLVTIFTLYLLPSNIALVDKLLGKK